jgi:uncharacterized protein YggU (UPF0235/DUF167 family)
VAVVILILRLTWRRIKITSSSSPIEGLESTEDIDFGLTTLNTHLVKEVTNNPNLGNANEALVDMTNIADDFL